MVAAYRHDGESGWPVESGALTLDATEIPTLRLATADVIAQTQAQREQMAACLRATIARHVDQLARIQAALYTWTTAIASSDSEYWRLTATMEPTLDEIRALHSHAGFRARALVEIGRLRLRWRETQERCMRLAQAERRVGRGCGG